MNEADAPYYRRDLALVHQRGSGFHADACAPGILELLEPVRERKGLVVELGCGSGALTRHLVDAGHRMATFVRNDDGSWRRDDERHDNVMVDTALVPPLLEGHGVRATVASSFGTETLPPGLRTVIGHRAA